MGLRRDLDRIVVGGAAIGAATALIANVVGAALGLDELASPELTPLHVSIASLAASIAGAATFCALHAHAPGSARRRYAMIALALASAATIKVVLVPPATGFAVIAGSLHYVVAVISILAIPWFFTDPEPRPDGSVCAASRWLIAVAALITAISPLLADFNASHLENERWPPHARYHGLLLVWTMVALGLTSVTLVWRPFDVRERALRVGLASLLPAVVWASFSVMLAVPGTSSWPDGAERPLPIAPNVLIGVVIVAIAALAWRLDVRTRTARDDAGSIR